MASSSRHSASCSHIRPHWSSKWKEVFVQLELWTAVAISVLPGTHSDTLLIVRCWFFHWKPQPCCLTALLSGKRKIYSIYVPSILYCTIYTIYHIYMYSIYCMYCIYTIYLCSLQLTLILFRETETRGMGQTPG